MSCYLRVGFVQEFSFCPPKGQAPSLLTWTNLVREGWRQKSLAVLHLAGNRLRLLFQSMMGAQKTSARHADHLAKRLCPRAMWTKRDLTPEHSEGFTNNLFNGQRRSFYLLCRFFFFQVFSLRLTKLTFMRFVMGQHLGSAMAKYWGLFL